MTAPHLPRVSRVGEADLPELNRFYKRAGSRGRARGSERVLAVRQGTTFAAALRLEAVQTGWLLRGCWVLPEWRGLGLGSRLLEALPAHLEGRPCYCLAVTEAVAFYRRGGFEPLPDADLPQPLAQRLRRYRNGGAQLVPMRYLAWD